jgi:nitrite reductase/ring-hydroxylating ferredoxin subunit
MSRTETRRIRLVDVGTVPDGELRLVECNGVTVTLCRSGERWFAVDDACPHRGLSLSTGTLEGAVLTCSWHGYRYDLESGECLDRTTPRLAKCSVVVADGVVWLELDPRSEPVPADRSCQP